MINKLFHLIFGFLLILNSSRECLGSADIVGCGGFIKSPMPIDLSLVDVRLYTKQETLKESSDCAPTNGYYFIPLSDKGEYTLRVDPPAGWLFEPKEVPIIFDGVNDPCSLSIDINFHFKGFTVSGKVSTRGSNDGPDGVKVVLKTPDGKEVGNSLTTKGGAFQLASVVPGKYTVTASHNTLKFQSATANVEFGVNEVTVPQGSLVVAGYDLAGAVLSSGEPVKGVTVLLYPKSSSNGSPLDCRTTSVPGTPSGALCHVTTDSSGIFRFSSVPSGQYILRPFYEGFQVVPSEIEASVEVGNLNLAEKFMVKGFSVKGRVLSPLKTRGLLGAVVYVDGTAVATTDGDGRFQLERMESASYDITVKAENFIFTNKRVKITPALRELEPLVASEVRVCGRVTTTTSGASVPRLQIQPADRAAVYPAVQQNGQFCQFLGPGIYVASVLLNDDDSSLRYLPLSREFEVKESPINDLDFSQLRAVITGRIRKEQKNVRDRTLTIKLKIRDRIVGSITSEDDSYTFTDVAPGSFSLEIESQLLCFAEASHSIVVNSPSVQAPDFVQSGFIARVQSSHQTDLQILTPKRELVKSMSLERGENLICLATNQKYIFIPSGCHGYERKEITWEAGRDEALELKAISHDVSGTIVTNTDAAVDISLKPAGSTIITLTSPTKIGDQFRREFKLRLKDGEVLELLPKASLTVFTPEKAEVRGSTDCLTNAAHFAGERGKLVDGKINPPLENVKVTLKLSSPPSEMVQFTKADGKFSFGPLKKTAEYELLAEKESYVVKGPDSSNSFQAHKLAQVNVLVVDNSTSARLSAVLLSLTGGEKYRKNSITEESGERTFHSLSPGEYFLRPMMKEYKFEPASVIIHLKDGETKTVTLTGRRVAYSVFGTVTSLNEDVEEGVPVEVVGQGKCEGQQEEGVSDQNGAVRIRGLLPHCLYTLQMKADTKSSVYRVSPSATTVSTKNGDVQDIRLIAFHEVEQTDVSVHITATTPEHLKTLTLKLFKEDQPDSPVHVVRLDTLAGGVRNWGNAAAQERFLRGGLLASLPFLPKDGTSYFVTAESSLNQAGHSYSSPTARFTADKVYLAVDLLFHAKLRQMEQESPRHYVAGLFLGLLGMLYWQMKQGWPAVGSISAWWAARQEGALEKKKLRARKA